MPDDQSAAIAFLADPASYGLPADTPVERCETHASIVFLAGPFAYKLKRAVRYPYLDYGTAERRRAMCEAELTLNRRTAPDLYIEVRALGRAGDGSVAFVNRDVFDWVLVMRRLSQDDILDAVRRNGRLDRATAIALAEAIAEFHGHAERTPAFGGAAGMTRVIEENDAILRAQAGAFFEPDMVEAVSERSRIRLRQVSTLLDARQRDGFVRRCHGDLHLNNICLIEGRPAPFDAIEFNDDLACIDVFYDLAFPLMDIDRHGLRPIANALLNRYLERTADHAGVAALPLFLSARAAIRAHVTATAAAKGGGHAEGLRNTARRFLAQALAYLKPPVPRLVAVGGASGTGKSTLAYALAPVFGAAPGAVVLRSDILRKQLLGAGEQERLPASAYEPQITARVYARMAELAGTLLDDGCSVVADAVHGTPEERRAIGAVARRRNLAFDGIWLRADARTLEDRLKARRGDVSDATVAVLRDQLRHLSEPTDWHTTNAGPDASEVLGAVRAQLSGRV